MELRASFPPRFDFSFIPPSLKIFVLEADIEIARSPITIPSLSSLRPSVNTFLVGQLALGIGFKFGGLVAVLVALVRRFSALPLARGLGWALSADEIALLASRFRSTLHLLSSVEALAAEAGQSSSAIRGASVAARIGQVGIISAQVLVGTAAATYATLSFFAWATQEARRSGQAWSLAQAFARGFVNRLFHGDPRRVPRSQRVELYCEGYSGAQFNAALRGVAHCEELLRST